MTFAKEIWDTLSREDISGYTKDMQFGQGRKMTYLPWYHAWTILKSHYPASTYYHLEDTRHEDDSMEVEVAVNIRGGDLPDQQMETRSRLAVMDNRFNAIMNPDARQINDARQRALVKALAFMGLGLSLWDEGSQVPVGTLSDPINPEQAKTIGKLLADTESDVELFLKWAGVEKVADMPSSKYKFALRMLKSKGDK
jgi:hypothetical protein